MNAQHRQHQKPGHRIALSVVLLAALIPTGTRATAIEKLVMPGALIEAHASFEAECQNCHAPLSELPQRELCTLCHLSIGADIESKRGFHGRDPAALEQECSTCHTDHEGRDAKIVDLDVGTFNHDYSDFPLVGAHLLPSCPDCHEPHDPYRNAANTCIACHAMDDVHEGRFSEVCSDCHNQSNWQGWRFDHAVTDFQLTGLHADVTCSGCHSNDLHAEVASTCVGCHRTDDTHKGRNGPQCQNCHTTAGWASVTFNHFQETGFPLRAGHAGLTCQDCHSANDFTGLRGDDCASCHLDDDVHESRNGNDCGSCHGVARWDTVAFDHAAATGFALVDAHGSLACTACHTGTLSAELDTTCSGCHAEDDVHSGQLGAGCNDCHAQATWPASVLFEHDLTAFPLIGRHASVECKECHESHAYHDAPTDCLACHRNDDAHETRLGTTCERCHNPGNWLAWQFDHRTQTGFPLLDAHNEIACIDCHRQSMTDAVTASTVCGTCHRRDDKHESRFGPDCGRCHTTRSFSEVENL